MSSRSAGATGTSGAWWPQGACLHRASSRLISRPSCAIGLDCGQQCGIGLAGRAVGASRWPHEADRNPTAGEAATGIIPSGSLLASFPTFSIVRATAGMSNREARPLEAAAEYSPPWPTATNTASLTACALPPGSPLIAVRGASWPGRPGRPRWRSTALPAGGPFRTSPPLPSRCVYMLASMRPAWSACFHSASPGTVDGACQAVETPASAPPPHSPRRHCVARLL